MLVKLGLLHRIPSSYSMPELPYHYFVVEAICHLVDLWLQRLYQNRQGECSHIANQDQVPQAACKQGTYVSIALKPAFQLLSLAAPLVS